MPALTADEVATYLAEPGHLVRMGTVDLDGAPSVVPAWFTVEDGWLVVTPRARSAWLAHVRREPRVCFTVDEEAAAYRKVIAKGTVSILHDLGHDDEWRDLYRRITLRYVTQAWGDAYLADTHDEPRALLGIRLADASVTTFRMPGAGEDPRAVWAPRYFHPNP